MIFYIIAIIVVIADQLTKVLIRTYIDIDQAFTIWGIPLTHIENSGMAGGLFPGNARLFGLIAVLFVVGVLYFRKTGDMKGALIDSSFGFFVGGAIGNGIDRLLYGQVTDFIIRRNGVLNIADHAIEIGALLLIMYGIISWFKKRALLTETES
ncbi:MAG TPA: signal peptidase II [Candidatus Paenibacillus intestinavium]|nr:signal peptidase II [Candidatus Paenibacillus intestinavium]